MAMKRLRSIFWAIFAFVNTARAISLNGAWTVTVENFETSEPIIGSVPGGIYTDLVNAKLIPENLKDSNDVINRWVGNRTVTYTRKFDVDEDIFGAPKVLLIFDGLDTFATISVNNRQIGNTSNMFLRHHFDVKKNLKIGSNELNVTFRSAIKVANDLYAEQSANYTVPPLCVPKIYNGECHVNHIRKMQASFGWDWGPAFPSVGIWKKVELLAVKDATIFDFTVDVEYRKDEWNVIAKVIFAVGSKNLNEIVHGDFLMKLETENNSNLRISKEISLNSNETFATESAILRIPKNEVKKWWPNGYGNQSLYDLKIQLRTLTGSTTRTKRIGFRKIELVQDVLNTGLTFYFRVNDVPIFAKGSNWIPSSVFPELSGRYDVVRNLLESSREANMNMLRVWGGGIYESDFFYELSNEYGIMIWQDFMFACSMYPTSFEFLNSVKEEIRQNVERLKHHPSIVVWAGNNENEAAIYGNWYGTGNDDIYKKDYVKLYVDVIKREVEILDKTRPFVVSSPSDGLWTENNSFIGPNPYSNLYGDVHYYNYLKNGWDINQYPITRFASEYGFQSFPSIDTLASATDRMENLEINSEFMKHRQHLLAGSIYMKLMLSKNFVVPQTNDSHRDFADYVYLSQIDQAVSVKIQTESYRQSRSSLNDRGEGYTMGALYWQLNDVWQAPSWSSIESTGRWKMLHFFAVEFFAPIIVTPRVSSSKDLAIYIVSDKLTPISQVSLNIDIYNWNSSRPIYSKTRKNLTISANAAQIVENQNLNELLEEASCGGSVETAKKNCYVELNLRDEEEKFIAPTNYVYPAPLKDVILPSASVTALVDPTPIPGKFANYLDYKIVVKSDEIALFVWLEVRQINGRFSENGFHINGRTKTLTFHPNSIVTAEEISKNLKITTLSDLYAPNRRIL